MEGGCSLVQPAGGTGKGVAIRGGALPLSLDQLDTPPAKDIDSREDLHGNQRIILWMAMTRMSFAPARLSWLMSI